MFWPIYIYLIASIAIAVSAGINAGLSVGLSAFGASALSLIAGGGLKASVWYGDKAQKIGGPLVAAVIMALAIWIAQGFSVIIGGNEISGLAWSILGAVICFIFANRKLAS